MVALFQRDVHNFWRFWPLQRRDLLLNCFVLDQKLIWNAKVVDEFVPVLVVHHAGQKLFVLNLVEAVKFFAARHESALQKELVVLVSVVVVAGHRHRNDRLWIQFGIPGKIPRN